MKHENVYALTQNVKNEVVLGKTAQTLVTQNADTNAIILPKFLSVVFGQKFGHLAIAYRDNSYDDMVTYQYYVNKVCSKFYDPIAKEFKGGQTFGFFHLEEEAIVDLEFIKRHMSTIYDNRDLVDFYIKELANLNEDDYHLMNDKKTIVKKLADKSGFVNIYEFPEVMEFGEIAILYSESQMALYISTMDNVELMKTLVHESGDFLFKEIDSTDLFFSKTSSLLKNPTFYNRCLVLLKNLTNDDLAELYDGKLLYYEGDKFLEKSRLLKINPGTISVNKLLDIERMGEFDRNYMIADVDELINILDRHDF